MQSLGISDFYVWDSSPLPDAEWAALNERLDDVRVFANTNLAGKAAAGRFDGLYTYDVLLFKGSLFPRLCASGAQARPAMRTVGRAWIRRSPRDRRPTRSLTTGRRDL